MSQYEQCQDLKTEAAKWKLVIINSIIHTCASPVVKMSSMKKAYNSAKWWDLVTGVLFLNVWEVENLVHTNA